MVLTFGKMADKIIGYLKLIRWSNIFMIALTMFITRYFLIFPYYNAINFTETPSLLNFILFVICYLGLASGANIINDVIDVDSDKINKPSKVIIGKIFTVEQGKKIYSITTIVSLIFGAIASYLISSLYLFVILLIISGLSWFYSTRYKGQVLVGNIVVSFLLAMTLICVWLFEFFYLTNNHVLLAKALPILSNTIIMVGAYSAFAFMVNLIREIVKDMEDVEGDSNFNCKTMAVVYGIKTGKIVAATFTILLFFMICFWQYFLVKAGLTYAPVFLFIADILAIVIVTLLFQAETKKQFSTISLFIKILMLIGISSIVLIHSL